MGPWAVNGLPALRTVARETSLQSSRQRFHATPASPIIGEQVVMRRNACQTSNTIRTHPLTM
jgi:hypothetical protein